MKVWPHCDMGEITRELEARGVKGRVTEATQPPLFSGVPVKGEKLQRISGTARFWAVDPEMPFSPSSPSGSMVEKAERCPVCNTPIARGDEECRRSGCR